MTATEHHIETTKTARFYTLGSFSDTPKHLWIVAHGYMQLGSDFIKIFEPIADSDTLIVSPEGLSRFYTRGFGGNIGASWMTKEDRLSEISDYVFYLDNVFAKVISALDFPAKRVTLLGFSQGCPTLMRWAALGNINPDEVVLWCGDAPTDLDYTQYSNKMQNKTTWFVCGNNDTIIPKTTHEMSLKLLTDKGLQTDTIFFEGGHEVPSNTLKELKLRLTGK